MLSYDCVLRLCTFRNNNNPTYKITNKEQQNAEDGEKEVNESILILGDGLLDSSYTLLTEANNLFSLSDQESTSGEEDLLGK